MADNDYSDCARASFEAKKPLRARCANFDYALASAGSSFFALASFSALLQQVKSSIDSTDLRNWAGMLLEDVLLVAAPP